MGLFPGVRAYVSCQVCFSLEALCAVSLGTATASSAPGARLHGFDVGGFPFSPGPLHASGERTGAWCEGALSWRCARPDLPFSGDCHGHRQDVDCCLFSGAGKPPVHRIVFYG